MKKIIPVFLFISISMAVSAQRTKPVLNHIALHVQDLQKATNFYRDLLGLDTIPEPFHDGKHTWFSIGPVSHLHLIAGATARHKGTKDSHICFSVPSVEAFITRLTKAGMDYFNWGGEKMKITNRVDGVKQIYLQDPDGYWIEVNDAKE
jgi:lactoylglutathione lyase